MRHYMFAIAVAACFSFSGAAMAEGLHVVRALPGYTCMMLNVTQQQSMDFSFHVPVRATPSSVAPVVGNALGVVAVRDPLQQVNGFVEALFPTGQTVWIAAIMLRPYHSLGDPTAKCVPAMLSNGKPGFDYTQ